MRRNALQRLVAAVFLFVRGAYYEIAGLECPCCGRPMRMWEDMSYECACGAMVDLNRGAWKFARETEFRPLPNSAGTEEPFSEERNDVWEAVHRVRHSH